MAPRPCCLRPFIPALLVLAATACVSRPRAPENVVGLEWTFASAGAREDYAGGNADTNLNGLGLTWETVAIARDVNLAVSYLRRRNKAENTRGRTFDAEVVRIQPRWQWRIPRTEDWSWYAGPGIGWVVSASEDPALGTDYRGGLYLDAETGVRYRLFDPVGIVGLLNISFLDVDGRNPASRVGQSTAMSFAVGLYADF